MKRIWKYKVFDNESTECLDLPKGAIPLKIGLQNDKPYMWILVDPDAPNEKRTFILIATGEPFYPDDKKYIATFFEGIFVWHVWEVL